MNVNDMNAQMVQTIGARLKNNFSGAVQASTWDTVLQASQRSGNPVGEIRTGEDLARVPRGKKLKAVYFPSDPRGAVVRWGDQSATHKQLLNGKNHDHFNRKGDNVAGGKQGYITIDSNGNMTIQ